VEKTQAKNSGRSEVIRGEVKGEVGGAVIRYHRDERGS
jgi:hypothetical protein